MEKRIIKKLARQTYKKFNTSNPYEILKQKDIELVELEMPLRLKGYTTEKNRIKIIYINSLLSDNEKEFTLTHELGHIILKHKDNILFNISKTLNVTSREENEANMFVAYLRMQHLNTCDYEGLNVSQISDMLCLSEKIVRLIL